MASNIHRFVGYNSQSGAGLGNVLSGIMRAAIPILGKTVKDVAKYAGRTFLQTGLRHLNSGAKRVIDNLDHHPRPTKIIKRQPPKRKVSGKRRANKKRGTKQPNTSRRRNVGYNTPRDIFNK